MKTKKQFLLAGLLASICSAPILATDYYVSTSGNDSNNGASSTPFRTIQHAVDAANGGDNIYVYGGTYSEKIKFKGSADSGSSGNLVTLTNVSGENPIIDGSSLKVSGREGLITVKGASYIKISGFEIQDFTSSGGPTPCGFYMEGTCAQVEFSNNKIHDIINTSTCADPCGVGAHGIGIFGTTSAGITNTVFDNNEIYNNILQASEAFVINGNVDGFLQTNNYVHDNNNIGFDYIGYEDECSGCGDNDRARNGIVRGNHAENNRSDLANPWYRGDASAAGFYVDGGANILFENNISNGNNMGFEVASEHEDRNTENVIVRNNYIYNNSAVGISLGGSEASAAAINISVINNTFYKNHGWGTEIIFQSFVQNSNIVNNIFYADNTDAFESYNPKTNSNNKWANNLYYNGTAADGSVSTSDPQLSNPDNGNLDLTASSPAIGAGTNSATDIGTTDIKGNDRVSGGTVDIGAHEYGSDGNDGGTTTVNNSLTISSLSEFSAAGASQAITVSSNVDWTVSENSNWITVNTTSGFDNGTVSVTANANTTTATRSATITISGGNITRSVTVSQAAAEDNNDNNNDDDNNDDVVVVVTPGTCTAGTNLSLNGTIADFSSEQNTVNNATNAIDGDDTNRWAANGFPQYVVIDLGSAYDINQVNLVPYLGRAYQFTLEGSTTSATAGFSTLTNETNNTAGGSLITKTFTSQSVQFVKLTITGAAVYTGTWASINDFKVICAGEGNVDDNGNDDQIDETETDSCTAGSNLSLNSVITEFSAEQNTTNTVTNLVDGNDTDTSRWSAQGFPQSAVIDLGAVYDVNQVNLYPYLNRAYQFTVQGSATSPDNGYSTLRDATNNTVGGSVITRTFDTYQVRYIKLTITGASGYTGTWASINEFEVICAGTTNNKNIFADDVFEVTAYPSPFTDSINVIANDTDQAIGSVKLVDLTGRIIATGVDSLNNLNVANGVYLLQVFNTNNELVKVIKVVR